MIKSHWGARRTWAEFPVWKAHQTKIAENETMSLYFQKRDARRVRIREFLSLQRRKWTTDM